MQKFVPRTHNGIFGNEHTRSTPLNPKLMFWCIFVVFGCIFNVSLLHETQCKTGWTGAIKDKFVPLSRIGIFRNKCTRSTPLDPNIMFWCVFSVWCIWDHFVTAWNSAQNGPKWCNYCKSSCHEVASEFFATNAPDPPHWTQNSYFGAFRSVWVHLGPFHCFLIVGSKTGRTVAINAKVRATESRLNFSLQTRPIHTIGP